MKIPSKFSLALLAGTILSTPANYVAAATLTPTLDTIKAEAADLSGNFALTKLTDDLQEGAAEVEIAGVKYYFTPTGDDAALLKTLAGTVAGNLKEDENGIFEFDGKKYSFNTEAIPGSIFEYAEGTAEDYNFIVKEADDEGNLTDKYYKINLKPENFSASESITWGTSVQTGDTTGSVAVNLPHNQMQTFYYAYNKPADYTEAGTRIDDTLTAQSVTSVIFKDMSDSFSGGAIYNTQDHGDIDITADFIGNYVNGYYVYGGAIDNRGTIGNIIGNFIGNYVSGSSSAGPSGGALHNSGTIGNITGNFIGNYAQGRGSFVNGGAIYNGGTIGDITGDFIRNYADDGGAIYNSSGTIGNITGDFIGNYVSGSNNAYGGAILNNIYCTIGNITGNFIGNYTDSADGGAIHNGGTINNITGDFIGNYADEKGGAIHNGGTINNITGDFIGNYAYSYGGAISIYTTNTVLIGNITGNFTGNHAGSGGAISSVTLFDSNSSGAVMLGNITGDFIENYAQRKNESASGGAIYNGNDSTIRDITGDFIGNYASSDATFYKASGLGGAILNSGIIGNITGDFIGNYAQGNYVKNESSQASGGAIRNRGTIGNITGDFIENYAQAISASGGAIYNEDGTIGDITGDFIGSHVQSESRNTDYGASGGAIFNNGTIGNITGDFIENYAESRFSNAYGGAVYNEAKVSVSGLTNLLFHINVKYNDQEMEIYLPKGNPSDGNMQMVTGTITVNSEEEFLAYKKNYFIYTQVLKLDPANITAADYVDLMIQAGVIPEDQRDEILAEFEALPSEKQEEALSEIRQGAELIQTMVNNATPVTEITATVDTEGGMTFYNSSFRNNYVKSENGEAKGGAIYGSGVTITADNYTSVIDGNKANDESNAFYVLNKTGGNLQDMFPGGNLSLDAEINMPAIADLTFNTLNNGVILLNDGIDGESGYGIAFNGDKGIEEENLKTTQYIKLNNSIANAGSISITNTTLSFGEGPYGRGEITAGGDPITKVSLQNAAFDLYNNYHDEVKLAGWNATDSYLHVDVDVENLTADMLNINGNVEGTTKVIVYANSEKDITDKSIVFAQSTNDTTGNKDSFSIYRIYGNPYMFDIAYTQTGTNSNQWALTMEKENNPNDDPLPDPGTDPEVPDIDVPDVDIPDIDIPDIDIPDINRPLRPGVVQVAPEVIASQSLPSVAIAQTANMVYNIMSNVATTNVADISIDAEANHNLWVNPIFTTMNIESPTDIDADIWGIEAGGDIQHDVHNRLGIFVSYRQGEYDMNGNGDRYYSTVGSKIDIDSYIAGLYYRYDNNNWYAFATLYGGIQEADIKTDDGMKSDTDGVEFGASIEAGYDYALTDSVTLTPELGVFYTQVNYDDATDNMGKRASYDDARQIELEAGVKLARTFITDESFANVYVKPSVVQTIVDGDEVNITGLGDVEALDDATLGRIEIGGRYGFTTNLSAYGWANYTFGSDYDATTFGLGLNYAF